MRSRSRRASPLGNATTIVDRSDAKGKRPSTSRDAGSWGLVIVASPVPIAVGRVLDVGKRPVILGRIEEDDITDTRMSRNHATVWLASPKAGGLRVRDGAPRDGGGPWKRSANGTWLGESELGDDPDAQGMLLEHGATVRTGQTLWMAVLNPDVAPADSLLVGVSQSLGQARDEIGLVVAQVALRLKRKGQVTQALLVTGPRGTGKQVVAREAHRLLEARVGKRAPFRQVSAPSLADGTVAADLYGVVDRYATNIKARPGYFEQADGGVLLLDEVGDTPVAEQAKLLNLLQERQVTPLGGQVAIPFNCLVVSATNKDLTELSATGAFREDLIDRLGRFRVHLEPLDSRPEDVPFIARSMVRKHGYCQPLTWDVVDALVHHTWEGSVRELDMVIERAVALAERDRSDLTEALVHRAFEGIDRPRRGARRATGGSTAAKRPSASPGGARGRPEREELLERLVNADWNKAEVARAYGKHPRQVTRWMAYLEIERPDV